MCHLVNEYKANRDGGVTEDLRLDGGGSSATSGMVKAEAGVGRVLEQIEELGAVSLN
jgi:hypothetical protein